MKTYYRISDNSFVKPRFGDKRRCLENFVATFAPSADELVIIADRCGEATIEMIRQVCKPSLGQLRNDQIHRTEIGNGAGSWRYAAQLAMQLPDNQPVYLLEDDYLHLPDSRTLMMEGLTIAQYVTLYDHPDKYIPLVQGGNPFVEHGGELTRVLRTTSSHWRFTSSTTMTFATTAGVLRADYATWDRCTQGSHPNDYAAFLELHQKGKMLAVCIPGRSTHCDVKWAGAGVNWDAV
jgi:hypothetical protein